MNRKELAREFDRDRPREESLPGADMDAEPSASHDANVLAAARAAAAQIQHKKRARSWRPPLGLAAVFVAGLALPSAYLVLQALTSPDPASYASTGLTIPAQPGTRGTASPAEIPVEQAAADDWYRYIQELLYAGELGEAEQHLRRFNELHPDYRPLP